MSRTIKVNFANFRKQGAALLCCASQGCKDRVRTSKRIPSCHLLQGNSAALSQGELWFCVRAQVYGQFSHHRKPGAKLLCCASSHGFQVGVRNSQRIPPSHLLQGSSAALFQDVFFCLALHECKRFESIFSPQKAGSRTFVLCLTGLPGQGEKQQENSFLEPSPGEQCCTFPRWLLLECE